MKKILFFICIILIISCTGFKDEYEFHFFNNTNRNLLLKFYELDGSGKSIFFELKPNKDTISNFTYSSASSSEYDSLYMQFDTTKFQTFLKTDTSSKRNVFKQRQGDYTFEVITHKKNNTNKFTYTITEQDYIKADSIR